MAGAALEAHGCLEDMTKHSGYAQRYWHSTAPKMPQLLMSELLKKNREIKKYFEKKMVSPDVINVRNMKDIQVTALCRLLHHRFPCLCALLILYNKNNCSVT